MYMMHWRWGRERVEATAVDLLQNWDETEELELVFFFPSCLAGDPDIAGACELCSWSVSLLRALDRAVCLWLCLLVRVCGE